MCHFYKTGNVYKIYKLKVSKYKLLYTMIPLNTTQDIPIHDIHSMVLRIPKVFMNENKNAKLLMHIVK